jgi:hypothetical protein
MIRYRLQCDKGHSFEGWFQSSDAFDRQAKRKQVTCVTCGSHKVEKALMAPNVVTSERKAKQRKRQADTPVATPPEPVHAPPAPVFTPEQRELIGRMRKLRDEMLAKSEYVGPRFAEEARRIHSNEGEVRGIHGEANLDDVRSLVEEGIEVLPIPVLPDDLN